jgi:photosystem II stability/assembly factor-like uncharacterized protein
LKFVIALAFLIGISDISNAQWKEIGSFEFNDPILGNIGMYITCTYFLPGVPKVGFVGTETELDKTTDGGRSWYPVWDTGGAVSGVYVSDICFKDSLNGWFAILGSGGNPPPVCFRTTDGGESWSELSVPNSFSNAHAIYYNNLTNRLFICGQDTVEGYPDSTWSGIEISTNFGNTWKKLLTMTIQGFSFSNDSIGIASAFSEAGDTAGIIRTTDGGITWTFVPISDSFAFIQPLAIPGTPICFACTYARTIIYRSDDYGQTWRVMKDFGPLQDSLFNTIAPYAVGCICGDLSRLYIQTDTGMFVSIDSGYTWQFDGGPAYQTNFTYDRFYCAHGYAFAAATISTSPTGAGGFLYGNGLWEEIWPQAGVAENIPTSTTLRVFPDPATSSITIESPSGPVAVYDPLGRKCLVRELTTPQPPPTSRIVGDAGSVGVGESMDVSGLPPGVYFVTDGTSHVKLVKE